MQLVTAVPEETELRSVCNREGNSSRLPQSDNNICVSLRKSTLAVFNTYVIQHPGNENTHLNGAGDPQEGGLLRREVGGEGIRGAVQIGVDLNAKVHVT